MAPSSLPSVNQTVFPTNIQRPADKDHSLCFLPPELPDCRNHSQTSPDKGTPGGNIDSPVAKTTAQSIPIVFQYRLTRTGVRSVFARVPQLPETVDTLSSALQGSNAYPAAEGIQKRFADRSDIALSLNEHLIQNDCLSVPELTTHWISLQSGGVTHSSFLDHAMTTMTNNAPSSPSSPNELHYGLHHLVEHNANPQYEWHTDQGYMHQSQPNSNYASPFLMPESYSPPDSSLYMHSPPIQDAIYGDSGPIGLGVQYGSHPGYYHTEQSTFNYPPTPHEDSPLTPRSLPNESGRRPRSGRSAPRSDSPQVLKGDTSNSRVGKSPKTKKPKANKTASPKTPKLEGPLSELTKAMTDVPIRDMEAWVNRPVEQREKEVEKRNGYVTRPMNSFMLYRSAYSERTKMWCLQNNHQVVSSVSGESWPLEPVKIREHYNDLAKLEREHHAKAHPSYKFSPSKGPTAAARKKKADFSDDEDASDVDNDWEWRPRGARASSRRPGREAGYPSNHFPHVGFEEPQVASTSQSPWDAPMEFKQLPSEMQSPGLMASPYYQMPYPLGPGLPAPAMGGNMAMRFNNDMSSGMTGQHSDMLMSSNDSPDMYQMQVDPTLLQLDGQDHGLYEPFQMESPSQFDDWMETHGAS